MRGNAAVSTTHGPSAWSGIIAPGVQMSVGEIQFDSEMRSEENLAEGLKLAVLLEGVFQLGVSGDAPQMVRGSSASLFLANAPWQLDHLFDAGTSIKYLTLHLDAAVLEDELEASITAKTHRYGSLAMFSATTPLAMTALAHQMFASPYSGTAKRLYLAGKGLELTALALDCLLDGASVTQTPLAVAAFMATKPMGGTGLHPARKRRAEAQRRMAKPGYFASRWKGGSSAAGK